MEVEIDEDEIVNGRDDNVEKTNLMTQLVASVRLTCDEHGFDPRR